MAKLCDATVAVLPADLANDLTDDLLAKLRDLRATVVAGGATRSDSVRCGLRALSGTLPEFGADKFAPDDIVVVHDAVRPLATEHLAQSVISAVAAGADAAVPTVAVVDTIRHLSLGQLDRSDLRAVQTPQAFNAKKLWQAHQGDPQATDDASLIEATGGKVELVEGDPLNFKITHPADLAAAEALLSGAASAPVPSAAAPAASPAPATSASPVPAP